jgi:hypothetical protein
MTSLRTPRGSWPDSNPAGSFYAKFQVVPVQLSPLDFSSIYEASVMTSISSPSSVFVPARVGSEDLLQRLVLSSTDYRRVFRQFCTDLNILGAYDHFPLAYRGDGNETPPPYKLFDAHGVELDSCDLLAKGISHRPQPYIVRAQSDLSDAVLGALRDLTPRRTVSASLVIADSKAKYTGNSAADLPMAGISPPSWRPLRDEDVVHHHASAIVKYLLRQFCIQRGVLHQYEFLHFISFQDLQVEYRLNGVVLKPLHLLTKAESYAPAGTSLADRVEPSTRAIHVEVSFRGDLRTALLGVLRLGRFADRYNGLVADYTFYANGICEDCAIETCTCHDCD